MHIIFDFDGVILNSHKIKTKAFYKIFESYGKNIANKAVKFHKQNIGKSRYFKFKFILKNIIKKKISKKELLVLNKNFDFIVEKNIKKIFPSKYLQMFLKNKGKNVFYISTGTPQNKIIKILKDKKLFSFFKKVYGSPSSKVDHIKSIKKRNAKLLFIGDSLEDYRAAKKTKINFLLKLNSENISFRKSIKTKNIHSFKFLYKHIDFLQSSNEKI